MRLAGPPRKVWFVHPVGLGVYVRAGLVTVGRGGRTTAEQGILCQVCGSRGHLGRCRRGALRRAERSLASLLR